MHSNRTCSDDLFVCVAVPRSGRARICFKAAILLLTANALDLSVITSSFDSFVFRRLPVVLLLLLF